MRTEAAAFVAHAEHADGTAMLRDAIDSWRRIGVTVWPSRARAALAAMQHEPHDGSLWPYPL
jgi:hypothetical protein